MPNSTSRQFVYTIHDRPRCLGSTLWAVIDRRYRGQDVKNLVRNGFLRFRFPERRQQRAVT